MLERLKGLKVWTGLAGSAERLTVENAALRAKNAELEATVARLTARIGELEERLGQQAAKLAANSRNSSKPPSSDGPSTPPRERKKSKRKRGGQPGHTGTTRAMVPLEQVDEVVDCRPTCCEDCGALLLGEDLAPERRQVIDIPKPTIIVREYRVHQLVCVACGHVTAGEWPAGLPDSMFGAGLHTLAAILVGRFRQSKRLVVGLFEILYDLSLSPASICAMERRVAAALAAPVAEAKAALGREPVVGMDETGWRHMKNKAWLWLATTEQLAVFTIARRRSSAVVKQMLGEVFGGVVCCDRWSAYAYLTSRQHCWAHLRRDFTAMIEPVFHNCGHTRSADNPRQHGRIGPFGPTRRVTTAG